MLTLSLDTKNLENTIMNLGIKDLLSIISILFLGLILILLVILVLKKGIKKLAEKEKEGYYARHYLNETVASKWKEITELMKLGGPSRFKTAVVEADKLLFFVLTEFGYQGNPGEKLKAAKEILGQDYHNTWEAHICRNRVVHEVGYVPHSSEAKDAILKFEKALKDLGVL